MSLMGLQIAHIMLASLARFHTYMFEMHSENASLAEENVSICAIQ